MFVDASTFPATQFSAMPQIDAEWAPTSAPLDAPVWTSLASRVHELKTQRGRSTELEQYQAGKLSLVCDSVDRLLDPSYTGGPWAGSVFPNRQIRVQARYAGVTYDIINAFADGWPQAYEMNTTKVAIEATDGFKVLAATDLLPLFDASMRTDAPTHWWKMNDASTPSMVAIDSGYGTQVSATYMGPDGRGKPSIRVGNDGSTQWAVKFNGATTSVAGSSWLKIPVSARPAAPATVFSFECWFVLDATQTSIGPMLFLVGRDTSGDTTSRYLEVEIATDGSAAFLSWRNGGASGGAISYNPAAPNLGDGITAHQCVVTYSTTNTRVKLYVDGTLRATDSVAADDVSMTFGTTEISVNGNPNFHQGYTDAVVTSDFLIWDGTELTATQVLDHYNAGFNGYSGEGTGTHAGRVLDQTAWPAARRTIAAGVVNVGTHSTGGHTALDYLQTLARTERGEFYMETDGTVLWRDRNALTTDSRSTVSQATFGDSASETYHYSEIVTDYNEVQIRNDITITRENGSPQRVSDTTSIEKYLRHSYSETGSYDETDATALTKASAILSKYKDPKLRVTSIKILPGNDPTNLYPQVLGRKIGDRITVVRRPQGIGTAISQDCWIEGIEHDVTPDVWATTFRLVACS